MLTIHDGAALLKGVLKERGQRSVANKKRAQRLVWARSARSSQRRARRWLNKPLFVCRRFLARLHA